MQYKFRMMGLVCAGIVFCSVIPHYSTNCQATVLKLALENLISKSDLILVGKVENLQSNHEQEGPVTTSVTVAPQTFIKSSTNAAAITVKVFGGEKGEFTVTVSTEPVFKKGQKVLLFLKKIDGDNNIYRPVNSVQGKYTINTEGIVVENNLSLDEFIKEIKRDIKE